MGSNPIRSTNIGFCIFCPSPKWVDKIYTRNILTGEIIMSGRGNKLTARNDALVLDGKLGMTLEDLGDKYKISRERARQILEMNGVNMRVIRKSITQFKKELKPKQDLRYKEVDIEYLVFLYFNKKKTLPEVGLEVNLSAMTVRRRLIDAGYV